MLAIMDNALRLVNFAFLVILLGLVGELISSEDGHSSRVNFCMFAAAFGIVTDSFYGILANIWEVFAWPVILFALDFLNFAFTFSAATALAVGIRTHSCKNQDYLDSNNITQGSTQRCRLAQASVAFFYFSFFIFLAKMIMSLIGIITNGPFSSRTTLTSRRRKSAQVGVPTISQV